MPTMSLETSKFSTVALLSCTLLALGACGDDDGGAGTNNDGTGTAGTAGSDDGTPTVPDPTADSTGGESDGGSTSSSEETGVADSTGGDDTTSDGSDDTTTGAPADCMGGMSFATLSSANNDLVTNLDVAGLVSCNQDITISATGGTVCANDDGDGGFYYTIETIELEDVPPMTCGLAEVGLSSLSIQNIGDSTEVVVPQAGGAMVGNQSVTVLGDVGGTALAMPIPPTPLAGFDGLLPEGDVAFGDGDTTFTYSADGTIVATAMPEVVAGVMVTVTLTGIEGGLTFAE